MRVGSAWPGCRLISVLSHSLQRHELPPLPGTGKSDTVTKENVGPAFRSIKVGEVPRTLPESADPQVPSAQNDPYAKVAHFGTAHPDLLQWLHQCGVSFSFERRILTLVEPDLQMTN